MTWIPANFNEEQMRKVGDEVALAEAKTAGEIVPMIVKSSSAVGHLPLLITSLLGCAGALALMPFYEYLVDTPWIFAVPAGFLLVFLASFPLSQVAAIQRWLIPDFDEELQVRRRAAAEFALAKISKHTQRTGVLIFASVMERKVVVLPDEGLQQACPPEKWAEVAQTLATGLKKGDWSGGFARAIRLCGGILEKAAPGAGGAELANSLIIKE